MRKIIMTLLTALAVGCGSDSMPVVQMPEIDTSNPLLAEWNTPYATPPFDQIKPSDYKPAFETAIAVARAEVDAIVNNPAKPTFKNTIVPLGASRSAAEPDRSRLLQPAFGRRNARDAADCR